MSEKNVSSHSGKSSEAHNGEKFDILSSKDLLADEKSSNRKKTVTYDQLISRLDSWIKFVQDHTLIIVIGFIVITLIPTVFFYATDFYDFLQHHLIPATPMNGEFNIAVAEFSIIDENGKLIKSNDGYLISEFLFSRLNSNFSELDVKFNYEIRGPSQVGIIRGIYQEERAQKAHELAKEIGAHIIIYGVVNIGDRNQLEPEFYVNYQGFEEADDITGQHALGSPLDIILPFDATKIQNIENPAISARAEAISLLTVGLAYFSIDNIEKALEYFKSAESVEGWLPNAGKEVAHLLIGNAYIRLSSMQKSDMYLDQAYDAYCTALALYPEYTRAKVGKAVVLYLKALGDPSLPSLDDVDIEKLEEAETAFKEALDFGIPPESANIETKVHFHLGQIFLVQAQFFGPVGLDQAESEFWEVVRDYDNGNEMIATLASHAHARLGLVYLIKDEIDLAIDHYKRAIKLASPHYKAYYYSRIGEIYAENGQPDNAAKAYQEAIYITEFYGDEEGLLNYSVRLRELESKK